MTETKTKGEKWIDVGSFGWLVRYEHTDTWLDFKAYECIGEETHPNAGRKLFYKKDWRTSSDHAESIEDAEVTVEGFVKWDGCSEMSAGRLSPHFCGKHDVEAYGQALAEFHKLCLLLPSIDRDCAGYEDLSAASPRREATRCDTIRSYVTRCPFPTTLAGRLAFLMDLHGPPIYDDDGEFVGRDYANGLISDEQMLALMEMPDE